MLKELGFLHIKNTLKLRVFFSTKQPVRKKIIRKTDMELKSRDNPIVTKLDTPEFHSIFTQEVLDLKKLFDKYNYELRIAGGAVRDLLLGQRPKDLDFATPATPEQMKDMFSVEGVRTINPSGEKHGTVTARVNDCENFEVTTLRIDAITDGRHAEVLFTTDWKVDANRRDLTINSMFLGFDGSVYDYFFGYEDLKNRRVAFVGDPDTRIKEDYLRIMRYFRFYGRIAERPDNHDEKTLQSIRDNAAGLQQVSGERIWMELNKTLQGNFAVDLLKTMIACRISQYIGLPLEPNIPELEAVWKRAGHLKLKPATLLAALLHDAEDAMAIHMRLKLSAKDRDLIGFLVVQRDLMPTATEDRPTLPYEKLILTSKMKHKDAVDYVIEHLKYRGEEKMLDFFSDWHENAPRFPVGGRALNSAGIPPGRMYAPVLARLKDQWIDSQYKLTADDLVQRIPDILEEIKAKLNKQ